MEPLQAFQEKKPVKTAKAQGTFEVSFTRRPFYYTLCLVEKGLVGHGKKRAQFLAE
jgi:hypothetical protein